MLCAFTSRQRRRKAHGTSSLCMATLHPGSSSKAASTRLTSPRDRPSELRSKGPVRRDADSSYTIPRYHDSMVELTGRKGVRNDFTRYEVVALALVTAAGDASGEVLTGFPLGESRLLFAGFFEAMYRIYDHRFVFAAPDLKNVTA